MRGLITAVPHRQPDAGHRGLTSEESDLLNVITGFGDATEKRLREGTRMSAGALTAALSRLSALGYVKKVMKRGHRVYRATSEE